MSLVLLFPGQGVQHAAMLPWLDAHPRAAAPLAALAQSLGADWRARLADEAWVTSNAIAQCLMTGASLAVWQVLAYFDVSTQAYILGFAGVGLALLPHPGQATPRQWTVAALVAAWGLRLGLHIADRSVIIVDMDRSSLRGRRGRQIYRKPVPDRQL